MENNLYFRKSFVEKMLKLIPTNVKNFWKFKIIDFSKVTGFVRYDKNQLDSIYFELKGIFSEFHTIKFNFINGDFIFDSTYSQYDPINKKNIYPYENRYDEEFNIVAIYKFKNRFDSVKDEYNIDLDDPVFVVQYKNDEKLKEYYKCVDKFPYKMYEDLVKQKILNQPSWMTIEKTYNFLQHMWYKIVKLNNDSNKVEVFNVDIRCIKILGNDNLMYYNING